MRSTPRHTRGTIAAMRADGEGRYTCPSCGEEVVVPIDVHAGEEQEYVEDCPVCCVPLLLRVRVHEDGSIWVGAEPE
jgi:transcription elongation factor Elf1